MPELFGLVLKRLFIAVITIVAVIALFLGVGLALSLVGCTEAPNKAQVEALLSPEETFRHDLKVSVNGNVYSGFGVLPVAPKYDIVIFPEEKISQVIWTTCHQQQISEKPAAGWNKKASYTFKPSMELEANAACGLSIATIQDKATVGLAFFDFQDQRPQVVVPGNLFCNGWSGNYKGVTVCQSAAGLVQKIIFPYEVLVPKQGTACDVMLTADNKTYNFGIAPGSCVYYFSAQAKDAKGNRLLHRLTTIGYTQAGIK